MGNAHQSLGTCCSETQGQQRIIINFAIAHSHTPFKNFLLQNAYMLYDMMRDGVALKAVVEEYEVSFKPGGRKNISKAASSELELTVEEVYLPFPYELTILERHLKPYTRQQGLILTLNTLFHGEFDNGACHGDGTFLYLNKQTHSIQKTVKGRWQHNSPLQLSIYNAEAVRPLLSIAFLEGEQQAKITLPDRTTYFGSVRFAEARSVEEIMTGKGVINFPNKDIYIGDVRNGLMHTEDSSIGRFISKAAKTSYAGPYVNGYREGIGQLTIEHEGDVLCFRCEWKRGNIAGSITIESIRQQKLELPKSPLPANKNSSQSKKKSSPQDKSKARITSQDNSQT